jgi:hypothetical protein
LKRALDNNDLNALNAYLAALPQRTKNALFKAAGEKFGFITAEGDGVRYTLAADLAQRLHRHSDTSPIRHLLLRWNRRLVSLRSVGHDVQLLFKAAFKLPSKAAWTLFASWDHFAIACLKSETPMATEIQAYLLDAGIAPAANAITGHETGHSVHQLLQIAECLGAIEQRLTLTAPTDHLCYIVPEAQVLRFFGTDVMAMVPLVKALSVAPVVGSRRDQTDTWWRSTPVTAGG